MYHLPEFSSVTDKISVKYPFDFLNPLAAFPTILINDKSALNILYCLHVFFLLQF